MIKLLHLIFILLSISSFVGRVFYPEKLAEKLSEKILLLGPHAINAMVILTGFFLVFQGGWLSGNYGWIVAKLIALVAYVGLGVVAIKSEGDLRMKAFGGAVACFVYIGAVAVTKSAFIFF